MMCPCPEVTPAAETRGEKIFKFIYSAITLGLIAYFIAHPRG